MSRKNLNGLLEDILIVCPTAEAGLSIDEINCALGSADAVVSMVMMALIRNMNDRARATTRPINSSTANPVSGV